MEKKQKKSIASYAKLIVGTAAVFLLGWGIGSGRIALGSNAVFHRQVTSNKLPASLDYSSVEQLYDKLRDNFDGQLDAQKLQDGLKQGLVKASGDPYTEYLNSEESKRFSEDLNGTFTGIGAELSKDPKTGAIIVVAPLSGYPAEKAGLKPKDQVVAVDGQSTFDLSVSEAVDRIRGPKDSKVRLKIVRGNNKDFEVEITRAEITVPSVESQVMDGQIGYMKVSRFSEDTGQAAQEAAQRFKDAQVKGVILDLRGNPGGLLTEAVDVSGLWLDSSQTVLQEKRGNVVVKTYKPTTGQNILKGIPTIVLVDDGSASASEITAGALQDNKAATLLGIKTFGKGSVQSIEKLQDGGELKVTVAKWFTPNGRNINKEGIEPDKKVERSDEDYQNGKDPQKDAALQLLRQ